MYFCRVLNEASIKQITVFKDDKGNPAVNKSHRAHEAWFNISEKHEVSKVVYIVLLTLISINSFSTSFLS